MPFLEDPTGRDSQGHVLDFLGYLGRPSEALAGFITGIPEGGHDPLEGLWGGLTGKTYNYSDNEWLDLALKMGLDPLNLVPGLGLGTKLGKAGRVARGLEKAYTSPLGKLFGHARPGELGLAVDVARTAARAEDAPVVRGIQELMEAGHGKVVKDLQRSGLQPKEIDEYMLNLGEAFQKGDPVAYGVQPEHLGLLKKGYEEAGRSFAERNAFLEAVGLRPKEPVSEEVNRFLSRKMSEQGKAGIFSRSQTKGGMSFADPTELPSREIKRWIRADTNNLVDVGPGGSKVITKEGMGGVVKNPAGGWSFNGVSVRPVEATLKEGLDAGMFRPGEFIENPFFSIAADVKQKRAQISYLRMFKESQQLPESQRFMRMLGEGEKVPAGWTRLNRIPGFENWVAEPAVAQRLEMFAHIPLHPSSVLGKISQGLDVFLKTEPGRMFRHGTDWFKRLALGPHPGFYVANYVSDLMLAYAAGLNPARLPQRVAEAAAVQAGKKSKILETISSDALRTAAQDRNILGTASWAGSEARGAAQRAGGFRYYKQITRKFGKPGEFVERGGEKAEKAIDWMFREIGGNTQDNVRMALFIDYLSKAEKAGAKITGRTLDEAAVYSHRALIDYGDLTSFESSLRQVFPFYTWFRGIMGRTLTDLGVRPQKLHRLGRILDFTFDPLGTRDKALTEGTWMEGKGLVQGVGGVPFSDMFETSRGNPAVFGMGRFIPYGTIESLIKRPAQEIGGMVSPLLKSPVEMFLNRNIYKDRPIDPIAGGFPAGFTNPITGGPYTQAGRGTLGAPIPAALEHLIRSSPPGSLIPPVGNLAKMISPETFQDRDLPPTTRGREATSLFLRSKFYEFDRNRQRQQKESKEGRRLSELKRQLKWAQQRGDRAQVFMYQKMLNDQQRAIQEAIGHVS